jgi:Spy/CpxP family protein refolding chaperone
MGNVKKGRHAAIGNFFTMLMQSSCLLRSLGTALMALSILNATIPEAIAVPAIKRTTSAIAIGHKNSDAGAMETQSLLNIATAHPVMAGIELSEEQYAQLYSVTETTREQIASVTSSEQQMQFQATLAQSGDFNAAVNAMDLSSPQKSQLEFIVQVFGFQAFSILTPEQQRILSSNIENIESL